MQIWIPHKIFFQNDDVIFSFKKRPTTPKQGPNRLFIPSSMCFSSHLALPVLSNPIFGTEHWRKSERKDYDKIADLESCITSTTASSGPTPCTSTSDGVNSSTLTGRSTGCDTTDCDTTSGRHLYVHISRSTTEKREWDKKNCCPYCCKLSTNCMKHIMSIHKHEYEVQLIESKPKRSQERAFLKERLRLKGNYKHNCNVIRQGFGEIIPVRSPSSPVDAGDYVPCQFCLGFFVKKDLWRHCRDCKYASKKDKTSSRRGRRVITHAMMLLPSKSGCSEGLKNCLSGMNPDETTFAASHDDLIISFGEKLYQKHGHKKHRHQYIRQRIRELSRFLLAARKESKGEITDLESCINPTLFRVVITAVKKLCGYESVHHSYQTPSLALKIGINLKACADILRNKALMSNDGVLERNAKKFRTLCDSDWSSSVSAGAHATLETQRQNKPHVLPLTDDVKVVTLYLKEQRRTCLKELKSNPNVETWHALARATLANIILFNRRRSGEAARILVKDYQEGKDSRSVAQDDVLLSLSELEKHLVQNFVRIEVDGKRGRKYLSC